MSTGSTSVYSGLGRPKLAPDHLYKTVALLFLAAMLYRFAGQVLQVFLVMYAAVIAAVGLNALARRIPWPRPWSAAALALAIVLATSAAAWFGGRVLLTQFRDLLEQLPDLIAQLGVWGDWIHDRTGFDPTPVVPQAIEWARSFFFGLEGHRIVGGVRSLLGALVFPLLILYGGLCAVSRPNEGLLRPLFRAIPPSRRARYQRLLQLLGDRLVGWLKGQLVAMIGVGVLATLAFSIIGVPYAILLGVIYGLVEFVPILGPILGGVPAVIIAFLVDPMLGVWTFLAMVVIQQIESNLITPFAMASVAHLHPFVTLFGLVVFGSLFGMLGILLALPLVLLVWTVVEVLWVEGAIESETDRIDPLVSE